MRCNADDGDDDDDSVTVFIHVCYWKDDGFK